eukprot:g1396.t1
MKKQYKRVHRARRKRIEEAERLQAEKVATVLDAIDKDRTHDETRDLLDLMEGNTLQLSKETLKEIQKTNLTVIENEILSHARDTWAFINKRVPVKPPFGEPTNEKYFTERKIPSTSGGETDFVKSNLAQDLELKDATHDLSGGNAKRGTSTKEEYLTNKDDDEVMQATLETQASHDSPIFKKKTQFLKPKWRDENAKINDEQQRNDANKSQSPAFFSVIEKSSFFIQIQLHGEQLHPSYRSRKYPNGIPRDSWLLDVIITDYSVKDSAEPLPQCIIRDCGIDERLRVIVRKTTGDRTEDMSIISPLDDFSWCNGPGDLIDHHFRIQVVATAPRTAHILDTILFFGIEESRDGTFCVKTTAVPFKDVRNGRRIWKGRTSS